MQLCGLWKLAVQAPKKTQKFLMPMARIAFPDHATLDHLQRGKERRGAVALVIMRECSAPTRLEWQSRLSAIQCLNLALFINTEHHRVLRRCQIHAHDVG